MTFKHHQLSTRPHADGESDEALQQNSDAAFS